MNLHRAYVYILSNKNRTVLYIGVTNDLERRIKEHTDGLSAFTKKYNIHDLLFYEIHNDINLAIRREKLIKKWRKEWKMELIKSIMQTLLTWLKIGNEKRNYDESIN